VRERLIVEDGLLTIWVDPGVHPVAFLRAFLGQTRYEQAHALGQVTELLYDGPGPAALAH
jgi:hypothetical protein